MRYNSLDMAGLFNIYIISKFSVKEDVNILTEEIANLIDTTVEIVDNDNRIRFNIINEIDYPSEITENLEFNEFTKQIVIVEYTIAKFSEIIYFEESENDYIKKSKNVISNIVQDYIFFIIPDLVMFKGSKEYYDVVWLKFLQLLQNVIEIKRNYTFNVDFLLYLIEKVLLKKYQLKDDLQVLFIEDLVFDGKKDYIREILKVQGPFYIFSSKYVLMKLLDNNKPQSCVLDFKLKGMNISVEIKKKGRVEFFQDKGDFKKKYHNQRAFQGCLFIYFFIRFYEDWEKLPGYKKFLSIKFIQKILTYLKSKNIDYTENAIKFIKYYEEERKKNDAKA